MKSLVSVLGLLLGISGAASAPLSALQQGGDQGKVSLRTSVGVFAPILPVVSIANGLNPSVELESSSAIEVELGYDVYGENTQVTIYAAMTHIRSRMNHSSAMNLKPPARPSSPVNLFTPTGGFLITTTLGSLGIRPTLRLGVGVKFYEFNIIEVPDGVQDLTGDFGIGVVSAVSGSASLTAEARWMPSSFDPAFLPVSTATSPTQPQNDWVFMLGLKFGL